MSYQRQFDGMVAHLATRGVTVHKFCEEGLGALGHAQANRPNELHVCAAGRHKVETLTHESIHLLQFRLGVEGVEALLGHCADSDEYAVIRAAKWEDPMEAQAYHYDTSECARQIVMETLEAYTPPPPPPPPAQINLMPFLGIGGAIMASILIGTIAVLENK